MELDSAQRVAFLVPQFPGVVLTLAGVHRPRVGERDEALGGQLQYLFLPHRPHWLQAPQLMCGCLSLTP